MMSVNKQLQVNDLTQNKNTYQIIPPQIKIYNRYFYLRNAQHNLLQQQYQKQVQQLANKPKITINSYTILCEKLQKHIQDQIDKHVENDEKSLNFHQMQVILNNLNPFLSNDKNQSQLSHLYSQIWLLISHYKIESTIKSQNLFDLLRIVMDPYNLTPIQLVDMLKQIPQYINIEYQRQLFKHQYANDLDIIAQTINIIEIFQLWKKIKCQNPNLHYETNKRVKQQKKHQNQQFMSSKSRIYSQKSLNKYFSKNHLQFANLNNNSNDDLCQYLTPNMHNVPYHELLYHRKLEKDKILRTKRRESDENLRQNCRTLPAKEIKAIVNNLYIKRVQKSQINYKEQQQEEELKKCTFKPNFTHYNKNSREAQVRSFEKSVYRLQKGRKERKKKKQIYQNLGRPKKSTAKSRVPSFISRDTPRLILQIKISESRLEKIHLKGDEDAKLVAKKFVKQHNLQQSMQPVLQELVIEHLNAL